MNVVLVTGGFDPLHSGHIAYFKEAKKLGTKLIVCLLYTSPSPRDRQKSRMPSSA